MFPVFVLRGYPFEPRWQKLRWRDGGYHKHSPLWIFRHNL